MENRTSTEYSVKHLVLQEELSFIKNRPLANAGKETIKIIIMLDEKQPFFVKKGSETVAITILMDFLGEMLLDKTDEEIKEIAKDRICHDRTERCEIHPDTNEIIIDSPLRYFLCILAEGLYKYKKYIADYGPIYSSFDKVYFPEKEVFLKVMRDYARAGEEAIDMRLKTYKVSNRLYDNLLIKYIDCNGKVVGNETELEGHQWKLGEISEEL